VLSALFRYALISPPLFGARSELTFFPSLQSFTVLFGASSVGKTALCRQVLSSDQFHCIHFDLRLAGFADLSSLYFSLAQQMEGYFSTLPELMGEEWGWGVFTQESYAFKHFRLDVEKRLKDGGEVKTADIARLMELFQVSSPHETVFKVDDVVR
jgi:hypothetical protein